MGVFCMLYWEHAIGCDYPSTFSVFFSCSRGSMSVMPYTLMVICGKGEDTLTQASTKTATRKSPFAPSPPEPKHV